MKKTGILVLMMGLMLGSGYMAFFREPVDERGNHLAKAEQLSAGEYHKDAILEYEKVLELEPGDKEISVKIAHEYLLAGDGRKAVEQLESLISQNVGGPTAYTDLICGYLMNRDVKTAVAKVKEGYEKYPSDEGIDLLYHKLRGTYEETQDLYTALSDYRDGYVVSRNMDGKLCLLDMEDREWPKGKKPDAIDDYVVIQEKGKDVLLISVHDAAECVTTPDESAATMKTGTDAAKDATAWDGTAADAKVGNSVNAAAMEAKSSVAAVSTNFRYVDADGYLRVSPKGDFLYLGCPRDGRILFQDAQGWGYLDEEMKDLGVRFEDATAFAEGIAAVKEADGWRIVTPDTITEAQDSNRYADVVTDTWKCCSTAGNVLVKKEQGYVLVSSKGEVLSEAYDEARAFVEKEGVAAVCRNGQWGLIDRTGKAVCETAYEELCSGGTTLVAFRKDDLWGYMDREGSVYVEPEFRSAGVMSADGVAYVTVQEKESSEPTLRMIRMNYFYEDNSTLF